MSDNTPTRLTFPQAFPQTGHDHGICVETALTHAEELCREHGARLTETRRHVLELIWRSHEPVGAYALLESLRRTKRRAAAPTVYRALDFLMAQGLIHRIESLNAYVGCDHPGGGAAHGPFLLCTSCGQAFELMDGDLDAAVEEGASRVGFEVSQRMVELSGVCPRCRLAGSEAGEEPSQLAVTSAGEIAAVEPTSSPTSSIPSSTAETLSRLLVEVDGVAVDFSGNKVLGGVSLAVREGEIVTLIGPNGAGKTTLVQVILGLLRPSRGSVFRAPGLRLGYMPQRLELDRALPLPVTHFLALGGAAPRDAMLRILDEVGAPHLLDRPMAGLSGGELRRVLLARALLRDPDLLVLDEPVQGVDVVGQADLYRLISQVRNRHGCGVLMVSHDLHVVMSATDRVVCLNNHICCSGHPEAVSRHPEYLALFGPQAAGDMAVYTHHHDHSHDIHGDVLPPQPGNASGNDSENSAGNESGKGAPHDHG